MDKSSDKYLWIVILSYLLEGWRSQANLHTQREIQDGGTLILLSILTYSDSNIFTLSDFF